MKRIFFALFFAMLAGCQSGPEPIRIGEDMCEYCKMIITDKRFGSEVITKKGRVYKFDSIECMAAYYVENEADVDKLYAPDFYKASEAKGTEYLFDATQGYYVIGSDQPSPMGLGIVGFATKEAAEKFVKEHGGTIKDWDAIVLYVKTEWQDKIHPAGGHVH